MYPTIQTIEEKPFKHSKVIIDIVLEWKKDWLKARNSGALKNPINKFNKLKDLLIDLAVEYNRPLEVIYKPNAPTCNYNSDASTIIINESLSIISALHEFAHHINGTSETLACRWSVWLFKYTFPKAYSMLKYEGHVLTKKAE